jgi:CheY-like chemotaxis protein
VDGAQAIDTYRRHKDEIDIVLMDLGLPKIAGSEVIRLMKEQDRSIKIIVTTGYLEPELKLELFGTGVKDYIQKPYSVDQILEKLESAFA